MLPKHAKSVGNYNRLGVTFYNYFIPLSLPVCLTLCQPAEWLYC